MLCSPNCDISVHWYTIILLIQTILVTASWFYVNFSQCRNKFEVLLFFSNCFYQNILLPSEYDQHTAIKAMKKESFPPGLSRIFVRSTFSHLRKRDSSVYIITLEFCRATKMTWFKPMMTQLNTVPGMKYSTLGVRIIPELDRNTLTWRWQL